MGILDDLLGAAIKTAAGGAAQGPGPGGGLGGALGGALGGVLGGAQASGAAPAGGLNPAVIMQIVTMLLNKQGGLGGLVNSFNNAGLGDVVKSWISTGQNLPISPSQVTQVLGGGTVGQIASQLGLNAGQAGDLLSKVLPHVVDQLTPQGRMQQGHEAAGDPLTAAIGALAGKLFSAR